MENLVAKLAAVATAPSGELEQPTHILNVEMRDYQARQYSATSFVVHRGSSYTINQLYNKLDAFHAWQNKLINSHYRTGALLRFCLKRILICEFRLC